jgi:tetratricopeptide (TPR) repeat protein
VHRDFKPDNVLVGSDGRVLVGDFGLANIGVDEQQDAAPVPSSTRLTRAGSVIGTPPYMSPEQHQGKAVDARTDQFAFCAALYEALCETRPFEGATVAEIAERAMSGTIAAPKRQPPSRIYAAILRGLRADPAERFSSMTALLDELDRRRHSRLRWLAPIGGVVAVSAAAWFLVPRRSAPAPVGLIAVEPFDITVEGDGARGDWRESIADIIALTLADIDGVKAMGPDELLGPDRVERPDFRPAEARLGARVVVRGSIAEQKGRFDASVTLVTADGESTLTVEAATLAQAVDAATRAIARAVAPDRILEPSHARNRAQALYRLGDAQLRNANFQRALPYLEQTVVADPKLFEGWYALALARSWVLVPESRVFEAVEAARALAPTPAERTLVEAVARYLHHDLPGARAILEPFVATPGLSRLLLRDGLYFLGEAHWHDGHHELGVGYFRRALDIDMTFKLPVQHVSEYATAHRDAAIVQQYSVLIASSTSQFHDSVEFMLGHYDEVARSGAPPARFHALLVLGQIPPKDLEDSQLDVDPMLRHIYHAALALDSGDRAAAHAEIAEIWKEVLVRKQAGEVPDNVYHGLRILGDVVLCADMADEANRLVAFLAEQSSEHPKRNYQRMSILTAGLVKDRALIVRRELTDRDRQLADAIEAELSGDRERAASVLDGIVRDASAFWDYPERIALLRNLRALHRRKEAEALCDDTLRPAIFQMAYLPARRACREP